MAKSQKTSMNYSTKKGMSGGKAMGKTSMGIPPYTQKAKNVQMISPMSKTTKGKTRGSDMYC